MEDQIALGEVEDKGLDHLEHAGRGEFQIIHAMKGGRTEKVRGNWGRETTSRVVWGDLPQGLEGVAGSDNGDKEGDRGVSKGIV